MAEHRTERSWTWTTSVKLDVLRKYLNAFTRAAQAVPTRVYIDLFAGAEVNRDRTTAAELVGSARLALEADPPFTVVRCVELPRKAVRLEAALRADYPGRDVRVIPGDCNEAIGPLLADLRPLRRFPTFAFVDPDGMQVAWPTLEALAAHRPEHLTKVELWILFAAPGFMRTLALEAGKVSRADFDRADRLFGTGSWRAIYERRCAGVIDGGTARQEYVNLMRWQLEQVLGYGITHAVELRNEHGTPMYTMVFATDHKAGHKIMSHLYKEAYAAFPQMRIDQRRQRERDLGVTTLFEALGEADPTYEVADANYVHQPPWQPPGWTNEDAASWAARTLDGEV